MELKQELKLNLYEKPKTLIKDSSLIVFEKTGGPLGIMTWT